VIQRGLAGLALLWLLGFGWFALFLPQPAGPVATDGVVVLTGASRRIEQGLRVLERGDARFMLISGVDRSVRPVELAAAHRRPAALFGCCIDLGFQAIDTRSNALETARWVTKRQLRSIRLVTSDWHMRRARLELDLAMPAGLVIVSDPVPTRPTLAMLVTEYNKYWLRAAAALIGI
jgi:uncharacterized SAM-binding protein YcdF (DUF218 family)